MKRIFIVLVMVLGFPIWSNCQIKHNVWYGHFEVRSNSFLLPTCVNVVNSSIRHFAIVNYYRTRYEYAKWNGRAFDALHMMTYNKHDYYKWFFVSSAYDVHAPKWKLYDADRDIPTQGPDWWKCLLFGDFRHNYNFSFGYSLHWRSYDIPFGANFGVNYEWRGLYVKDGELAGLHKTSGIVPSANLSWYVLGNDYEMEHHWNVVVGTGTSYVKTLFYNDPLHFGKDKLNSGWRGNVSLSYKDLVFCYSFKYEWDFYNFFSIPNAGSRLNSVLITFSMMY